MEEANAEGRTLALEFAKLWIVNAYVPNSGVGVSVNCMLALAQCAAFAAAVEPSRYSNLLLLAIRKVCVIMLLKSHAMNGLHFTHNFPHLGSGWCHLCFCPFLSGTFSSSDGKSEGLERLEYRLQVHAPLCQHSS